MYSKLHGTIEHRSPGSWRVGFQIPNGKGGYQWIRKTVHVDPSLTESKQRKQAEVELAKLRADHEAQAIPKQVVPPTLKEFADTWQGQYLTTVGASTAKTYESFLRTRIIPQLGDVRLDRLTPMRLTEWLNALRGDRMMSEPLPESELKKGRRSPSDVRKLASDERRSQPISDITVRHLYDCLHALLDKAVQWEVIRENPMDKVDRPKARRKQLRTLTEEEAVRMLQLLGDEQSVYRTGVLLALLCGLRLGEVGALKYSDVDFVSGTIDISRALKYTPKTGQFEGETKTAAGERLIAVPKAMMAALRDLRDQQDGTRSMIGESWQGDGHIIANWDGRPFNHDTISKWFRRFADDHGFEGVRFHDLRHTHATILLANNIDAVAVAHRLGHSDPSVTLRIYAHALRRRDEDSANVFNDLIDGAMGEELFPRGSPNDDQ